MHIIQSVRWSDDGLAVRIIDQRQLPGELVGLELRTLDVPRFVAGCRATECEAVVISVGGVYAFYPSAVKYHYVSKVAGERDLVAEIASACRASSLVMGVPLTSRFKMAFRQHRRFVTVSSWASAGRRRAFPSSLLPHLLGRTLPPYPPIPWEFPAGPDDRPDLPDLPEAVRRTQPWGLGWRLNHLGMPDSWSDLLSRDVFGHTGSAGNVVWMDPATQGFCIVLTNYLRARAPWRRARRS